MVDDRRLTDRELDVMSILWRLGSGTVAEVQKELADRLAYTTVLWALQTLEEKGHVRHEKEGRAYRYYAVADPETAAGNALNRLVDKVFHGSAAMLLAQLVSERDLPEEELRRMRELLDRRLAGEEEP
jgi:BlaI family transcriptional regulator, penicillinase repressor